MSTCADSMSDHAPQSVDLDRYSRAALEALRDARWCFEHGATWFFCGHRHNADGPKRKTPPPG